MQPNQKGTDQDFVHLYRTVGPAATAKHLTTSLRQIHRRRARIERTLNIAVNPPPDLQTWTLRPRKEYPHRLMKTVKDGVVLIGSDAHYWPGLITTAHRAFVHFCGELKPQIIVKNGDVIDGAGISRHAPIGWEDRPALIEEIEAARERLGEIRNACPKAEFIWPLGNHDARYESRLAAVAPEYAKMHGVHLKDHFGPEWQPCWSAWINDDVVVKHRFKSGIHAPHNNTMWAGKTIITGHLHSLKVMPISDYNGTRYGVDCGTLAEPYGPQFVHYTEDNPVNWRSGFVVLTFNNGVLLPPELVTVMAEGRVAWRGQVVHI